MLLVFMLLGLVAAILLFASSAYYYPRIKIKGLKRVGILGCITLSVVSIFVAAILTSYWPYEKKQQINRYDQVGPIEHYRIAINEEGYGFYYLTDNEFWQMGDSYVPAIRKCEASSKYVSIYEEDIDNAYVIEYMAYPKNEVWQKILLFEFNNEDKEKKVYDIYVPVGTAQDLKQNVQDFY